MNKIKPKIYFAGSIRGGREYAEIYMQIISLLERYGEVLTEHVGALNVSELEADKTDIEIYEKDINWLKQADYIVAEVSLVSMGVGYELGYSACLNKKVLCLFNENSDTNLSAMISGNKDFRIYRYSTIADLKTVFKNYFSNE